jgi:hypothetical protein
MNVVFCWTGVTPAMVACWRAFAARPGVRLKLLIELPRRSNTAFDASKVLAGLDCTLRYSDEPLDRRRISRTFDAMHRWNWAFATQRVEGRSADGVRISCGAFLEWSFGQ